MSKGVKSQSSPSPESTEDDDNDPLKRNELIGTTVNVSKDDGASESIAYQKKQREALTANLGPESIEKVYSHIPSTVYSVPSEIPLWSIKDYKPNIPLSFIYEKTPPFNNVNSTLNESIDFASYELIKYKKIPENNALTSIFKDFDADHMKNWFLHKILNDLGSAFTYFRNNFYFPMTDQKSIGGNQPMADTNLAPLIDKILVKPHVKGWATHPVGVLGFIEPSQANKIITDQGWVEPNVHSGEQEKFPGVTSTIGALHAVLDDQYASYFHHLAELFQVHHSCDPIKWNRILKNMIPRSFRATVEDPKNRDLTPNVRFGPMPDYAWNLAHIPRYALMDGLNNMVALIRNILEDLEQLTTDSTDKNKWSDVSVGTTSSHQALTDILRDPDISAYHNEMIYNFCPNMFRPKETVENVSMKGDFGHILALCAMAFEAEFSPIYFKAHGILTYEKLIYDVYATLFPLECDKFCSEVRWDPRSTRYTGWVTIEDYLQYPPNYWNVNLNRYPMLELIRRIITPSDLHPIEFDVDQQFPAYWGGAPPGVVTRHIMVSSPFSTPDHKDRMITRMTLLTQLVSHLNIHTTERTALNSINAAIRADLDVKTIMLSHSGGRQCEALARSGLNPLSPTNLSTSQNIYSFFHTPDTTKLIPDTRPGPQLEYDRPALLWMSMIAALQGPISGKNIQTNMPVVKPNYIPTLIEYHRKCNVNAVTLGFGLEAGNFITAALMMEKEPNQDEIDWQQPFNLQATPGPDVPWIGDFITQDTNMWFEGYSRDKYINHFLSKIPGLATPGVKVLIFNGLSSIFDLDMTPYVDGGIYHQSGTGRVVLPRMGKFDFRSGEIFSHSPVIHLYDKILAHAFGLLNYIIFSRDQKSIDETRGVLFSPHFTDTLDPLQTSDDTQKWTTFGTTGQWESDPDAKFWLFVNTTNVDNDNFIPGTDIAGWITFGTGTDTLSSIVQHTNTQRQLGYYYCDHDDDPDDLANWHSFGNLLENDGDQRHIIYVVSEPMLAASSTVLTHMMDRYQSKDDSPAKLSVFFPRTIFFFESEIQLEPRGIVGEAWREYLSKIIDYRLVFYNAKCNSFTPKTPDTMYVGTKVPACIKVMAPSRLFDNIFSLRATILDYMYNFNGNNESVWNHQRAIKYPTRFSVETRGFTPQSIKEAITHSLGQVIQPVNVWFKNNLHFFNAPTIKVMDECFTTP